MAEAGVGAVTAKADGIEIASRAAMAARTGKGEGSIIGGRLVDLKNIKAPILHIMAQYDHIVPPECGKPLIEGVGSEDKEEIILPGGHVSLVAGANAVKRMWPKLDQWLERRST